MYIKRPLCVVSVAFALLLYIFVLFFPPGISNYAIRNNGKVIEVTGRVYKKEIKNDLVTLYIKDIEEMERIIVKTQIPENEFETVEIGCRVLVSGTFSIFDEKENDGQFDAKRYYAIRGIDGQLKNANVLKKSRDYNHLLNCLASIGQKAKKVFTTYMDESDAGTMQALILGDKAELDLEIKEIYQNAGISHILSLSGLHLAAVAMFVQKMLKKTILPLWMCSVMSMLVMLCYAILTGMSLSTKRALIMFVISIVADLAGRTYDLTSAASLSSIIILLFNPYYILDSGFLLSFGAIIGVAVVYPSIKTLVMFGRKHPFDPSMDDGIGGKLKKYVKKTGDGVLVSISISLATLPVVATSFFKVGRYSVFCNLIVLPFVGILLALGFIALGFGTLQFIVALRSVPFLMFISAKMCSCSLKIAHVILKKYTGVADFYSHLPMNNCVFGEPGAFQVIIYGVCLCLVVALGAYAEYLNEKEPYGEYFVKRHGGHYGKKSGKSIKRRVVLKALSFTFVFVGIIVLDYRNRSELEIRNLSIGQGDCGIVFGKNTPAIIIDGGSTSKKKAGKYILKPALLSNGIDEVEYVFLSHLDSDHTNAILELLNNQDLGIRIKNVVISKGCVENASKEDMEKITELRNAAEAAGCEMKLIRAGDRMKVGDTCITCLWPLSGSVPDEKSSSDDSNANSMVLYLATKDGKFSALFTGDISGESEKEMLKYAKVGKINYLKVPHHGSSTSSSREFLECLSPDMSVISVGKFNSYGHPHKETLERYRECAANSILLRTDEYGQVTVKVDKGEVKTDRFIDANHCSEVGVQNY